MLLNIYLIFSSLLFVIAFLFVVFFGRAFFKGAPYAPTTPQKIKTILQLLKGGKSNFIVDIGSGDGRIVIELAKAGYIAEGIENNPFLVWISKRKIKKTKAGDRAKIIKQNFWQTDFSKYDAVVLFGVFYIMGGLEKKLLAELKPGAVVISNFFEFPNWKYLKKSNGIYLYQKK